MIGSRTTRNSVGSKRKLNPYRPWALLTRWRRFVLRKTGLSETDDTATGGHNLSIDNLTLRALRNYTSGLLSVILNKHSCLKIPQEQLRGTEWAISTPTLTVQTRKSTSAC